MNRVMKWIGIAASIMILGFGAWLFLIAVRSSKYRKTAVPFMTKAISDISSWDVSAFRKYLDPEITSKQSDAEIENAIDWYRFLGTLLSIGDPSLKGMGDLMTQKYGLSKFVAYEVPAKFSNADAVISISLREQGGSFSIWSFNIRAPDLKPPTQQGAPPDANSGRR